jgi:hypothetical protein
MSNESPIFLLELGSFEGIPGGFLVLSGRPTIRLSPAFVI